MSVTCASRYEKLKSTRETYLDRARECSKLTLPSVVPPAGHTYSSRLPTPYQGIGARGVNYLAARLLLSLLPPNTPFFRLTLSDFEAAELAQRPDARGEIEAGLSAIERAVMEEVEQSGLRAPLFEALKHLIISGNCLIYLPATGGTRVFGLDRYVVSRDAAGNLLEIAIKESVSPSTLEEDVAALITDHKDGEDVDIYTKYYRDGKRWRLYQELDNGVMIPGSEGSWPIDKGPMLALRWNQIDAEDYGRGYVEEYLGDLISLEGLSRAILEASAAASKVVFLVQPNGVTRMQDLAEAESGDFKSGNSADVSTLQVQKQADMAVAANAAQRIEQRLSQAFMLYDSIQRDAERVTSTELTLLANALEASLGGLYSNLSQTLQLPLVKRLMERMQKQKRLPALPDGIIKPSIVTGTAALGRGNDLNNLMQFMQVVGSLGSGVLENFMNVDEFIIRTGASLGIDMGGLVKTKEQLQAEQQAQMQAQQQQQLASIAQSAAPNAVKAAADTMNQPPQQ
jgi:hypothetical protein